jgi:hypothetical protein
VRRATAQLVEDALLEAARRSLEPSAFAPGALSAAVLERSRRYTTERALLDAPLAGRALAGDLAARALFFTPADAPKLAVPLAELDRAGLLPRDRLRLLDLGAGCGSMAFAVLDAAAARGAALEVTAVDRDEGALAILAIALPAVARALGVPLELVLRKETVASGEWGAGFDLVTAGTVFNEIDEVAHRPLATRMLAATAPHGAAIVVEPALRDTARALHRLRDAMIEQGAHVFAPCTRVLAPCPMLADERDWCHEERPAYLPERAGRLAVQTGLRDGGLKFAYLVLRHAAAPQVPAPAGTVALRVVSHPSHAKGKVECFACGDLGRPRVRLLRRHRRDDNRGFERARRGDVLVLDAEVAATAEIGEHAVALHALPRDPS